MSKILKYLFIVALGFAENFSATREVADLKRDFKTKLEKLKLEESEFKQKRSILTEKSIELAKLLNPKNMINYEKFSKDIEDQIKSLEKETSSLSSTLKSDLETLKKTSANLADLAKEIFTKTSQESYRKALHYAKRINALYKEKLSVLEKNYKRSLMSINPKIFDYAAVGAVMALICTIPFLLIAAIPVVVLAAIAAVAGASIGLPIFGFVFYLNKRAAKRMKKNEEELENYLNKIDQSCTA